MTHGQEEQDVIDRFERLYEINQSDTLRTIERSVCGCDYGATSWTTIEEADRISLQLDLNVKSRLLDIGAGSGWPALYMARTIGCKVTLVDVPLSGLHIAAQRAAQDHLTQQCQLISADGASLPFENGSFDAISHSDVLCCLPHKSAVLEECRRVLSDGSKMAFTVILISHGLSEHDHSRACEIGPPYIDSETDYDTMLAASGWNTAHQSDVTSNYLRTVRSQLEQEEANAPALKELLGESELLERLHKRRKDADAIKSGLIRRELYVAEARPDL